MKEYLKRYNIRYLREDIRRYGYNYASKDFFLQAFAIMGLVIAFALFSRLQKEYVLILLLATIAMIPFLIHAYFHQAYNIRRFTMISDYLSNIIPIFIQKAKIRYTLGELYDIASENLKECIGKAIDYLDTTVDDPHMSANALKIIEDAFPNSRVKAVHKLLIGIEETNSLVYEEVCSNMYEDIENWIRRVFAFQKDLKNRQTKLLLLCVLTLVMNAIFSYLYMSNAYFEGFSDTPLYQISTLVFTILILITITLVLTKLHGQWLIEDCEGEDEEEMKKLYQSHLSGKPPLRMLDIVVTLLCIASGILLVVYGHMAYALICMGTGVLVALQGRLQFLSKEKKIQKALTLEFPLWLRDVSLNLNSYTVLNAIERSQNTVSFLFRKEIRKFLEEAKKDPTSIKAYNTFLSEYDLEDARSSLKVLYAIQNIGKENIKERISNLIIRNQQMLDKAETIKNNDSIAGVEALGYVPIVLFSVEMMVSMVSMFLFLMEKLGSVGLL